MPNYDDMSLNEIFKLDSGERIKTLNQLILKLEESGKDPELFDYFLPYTYKQIFS